MKRTKVQKVPIHIMTNDPSFTAWGWVVLNQWGYIYDQGCIKTKPNAKKFRIRVGDDRIRRINEINEELKRVIKEYNVKYLLSELPHGSQSAAAAFTNGAVSGILQTISNWTGIGLEWYSEADAKKEVYKRHNVSKLEMMEAIAILYEVKWTGVQYKDEAIADALAIHYTATKQSSTLKFLMK